MSKGRMLDLNRKINGIISEGSYDFSNSDPKTVENVAKGFAKIEKNKQAMAALSAWRFSDPGVDDAPLKDEFLKIIKKILSNDEYKAIVGMMN